MSRKRKGGAGPFPRPVAALVTLAPVAESPDERRLAPDTRPDPADLYAALDLGTNSCRMLIAQPKGNQLHVVDSFSKSVQLGQGLEASGRMSRASMARAVGALKICQRKLEKHASAGAAGRDRGLAAPSTWRRSSSRGQARDRLRWEIIKPEEEAGFAVRVRARRSSRMRTEQLLVVEQSARFHDLVWIDLSRCPAWNGPRDHAAAQGFDHDGDSLSRAKGCGLDLDPAGRRQTLKDISRCRWTDGARSRW